MKKEAIAVLEVLGRNQRARRTRDWKSYMILPQAVHEYGCPATRVGRTGRGRCRCGAGRMQKEFDVAWKSFVKAVRSTKA